MSVSFGRADCHDHDGGAHHDHDSSRNNHDHDSSRNNHDHDSSRNNHDHDGGAHYDHDGGAHYDHDGGAHYYDDGGAHHDHDGGAHHDHDTTRGQFRCCGLRSRNSACYQRRARGKRTPAVVGVCAAANCRAGSLTAYG